MDENIYFSLDEAREELSRRWNDEDVKKRVRAELGDRFMPSFENTPRGITFRQVCSPDNGFTFFFQCSKYINAKPLVVEYHDDTFVSFNEEKKGLGRFHVTMKDETKWTVDMMNFHDNEKKMLRDCVLKTGEKMIDFHRNLFEISGYEVDFLENSKWLRSIGGAKEYYYYFFLHFVAHGALFETFFDEGGSGEDKFTNDIILPSIKKIKEKLGIAPLIIRLYSANQNEEEDFYWWSYPPHVNDYIIEYANNKKFRFKQIK
ncbi:MAG: hypothetical protein WAZ96_05565 [Candidatus Moraniibacteriota bacterium]